MLRADLLLRLANHVEKMPQGDGEQGIAGFDMRNWRSCVYIFGGECDTASCLGGTAEVLFSEKEMPGTGDVPDAYQILSTLGQAVYMEDEQSDYNTLRALFHPPLENQRAWNATPAQAAAVVRYLVETGIVDWNKFVPIPELTLIPEQIIEPEADDDYAETTDTTLFYAD